MTISLTRLARVNCPRCRVQGVVKIKLVKSGKYLIIEHFGSRQCSLGSLSQNREWVRNAIMKNLKKRTKRRKKNGFKNLQIIKQTIY